MGTVPIGTGELRTIHSRVSWMLRPVERSMTVSAPQRIAQTILSTSLATSDATAELPMLALILTRKLRPIAIGSLSGWVERGFAAEILAGGDIFHFGGNDAAPGIVHLADVMSPARAQDPAADV